MRRRRGQSETWAEAARSGQKKWSRWEILAVFSSLLLLLYMWTCYENFHFHVTHFYAHLGYPSAQHLVGQRFLRGVGVLRDPVMASRWFSRAAYSTWSAAGGENRTRTNL